MNLKRDKCKFQLINFNLKERIHYSSLIHESNFFKMLTQFSSFYKNSHRKLVDVSTDLLSPICVQMIQDNSVPYGVVKSSTFVTLVQMIQDKCSKANKLKEHIENLRIHWFASGEQASKLTFLCWMLWKTFRTANWSFV